MSEEENRKAHVLSPKRLSKSESQVVYLEGENLLAWLEALRETLKR